MRKITKLNSPQQLIGGEPIDPTEPMLVTKSFFINDNGAPATVSRQFVEIEGSIAADFRSGGNDAEFFDLGNGNDTAFGGGGDDLMDGGAGNDKLFGDAGHDDLRGSAGMDSLYGGGGNDVLHGGAEADLLAGGIGDDLYRVYDTMDTITEYASEGTDTIYTNVKFVTLPANVERIVADAAQTTGGLVWTGNELSNVMIGGHFNDQLDGGAGPDAMRGGLGDDTYRVDHALDMVSENASAGIDSVISTTAVYVLPEHVEKLYFQTGGATSAFGIGNMLGNVMVGGAGNDLLRGLDGNDTLSGGGGEDTMEGGSGDDWYFVNSGGDGTFETEGGGTDTVSTGLAAWQLSSQVENLMFTISVNAQGQVSGPVNFDGFGNGQNNRLSGNIGHDRLYGGGNHDTLIGDQGNDVLVGGAGNDSLDGGAGNDVLVNDNEMGSFDPVSCYDTMNGGAGDDTYYVDAFDTVVEAAGGGIDKVVNEGQQWSLPAQVELGQAIEGWSQVVVFGNELNNGLWGASSADRLFGNAGDDSMFGQGGDDMLFGGAGNDVLDGGSGNDTLSGETGADTIAGGGGADVLAFNAGSSSAALHDVVVDFEPGMDRIDLRGLDGNVALAGDQTMAFTGSGAFLGGGLGSVRLQAFAGGTQVQVDVNGDANADLFIDLMGIIDPAAVSAADFML